MTVEIVATRDRPDLIPTVADWIWNEWSRHRGRTLAMTATRLAERTAIAGAEQTLVALADGVPVGTASLTHADLESRPDLTPWLASVFVPPEHRGRGHAKALVRAVEHAARAGGVRRCWLFTADAAGLYADLGWVPAGVTAASGKTVTLMYHDL